MRKTILTIFFILFAVIYDARRSFAQELPSSENYPNDSYIELLPSVCNETVVFHDFLVSKGWIMKRTYNGRKDAEANGMLVFVIAQYGNSKFPNEVIQTITIPYGETCLIFRGFDKNDIKIKS